LHSFFDIEDPTQDESYLTRRFELLHDEIQKKVNAVSRKRHHVVVATSKMAPPAYLSLFFVASSESVPIPMPSIELDSPCLHLYHHQQNQQLCRKSSSHNSVSNDSITIVSEDFVAYPYHHPRYSGDAIDKATERTMMGSRNEYTAEQQQQHQTQLHSPPPIPLPGIVVRQLTNI